MPGTERSANTDFARRDRVGQRRLDRHRAIERHAAHPQPMDRPAAGTLVLVVRNDAEAPVDALQFVDYELSHGGSAHVPGRGDALAPVGSVGGRGLAVEAM